MLQPPPAVSGTDPDDIDHLAEKLADGSCTALSFDVFGTVLWSRVTQHAELFEVLGSRLRKAGHCPEWVTDATFRRMRVAAENHVRTPGRQPSLSEVWRAMPLDVFDRTSIEELVAAEVAALREFLVVDLRIAGLLGSAVENGVPVLLIAETCLTARQLESVLDRAELPDPGGLRVFRSQEYGVDKASGLWNVVLEKTGLSPGQLTHLGAEERTAHALGVRTVPHRAPDHRFERVMERERRSMQPSGPLGAEVDPEYGDHGLTDLRAETLRSGPHRSSPVDTAWRYGACVLGPVLTGFAEWVASRAHETGARIVWCPMREGELLAELVNRAAAARGRKVEARPLWLSRQVTSVAAVDSFDEESVREFVRRGYRLTVAQLLGMLRLRSGDVPALAGLLDRLLDHREIVERVSAALVETPHLRNRLAGAVTAARERLLRSLRAAGALDEPEITLVDLGWGGTIQGQLARVLTTAGITTSVAGLYLATDERAIKVYRHGLRAEGYLGQAGRPHELVQALQRSPEVVEQCTNAVCGSLLDFAEDGSPILGPSAGNETQNAQRHAVQDGIKAFQEHWNRYVEYSGSDWSELTGGARHRLANILAAALRDPTAEEAAVFGNWEHDDNFGSSVVTRVIPDDLRAAIPYLSPNDLNDLHLRDAFWPALLGASDPGLGAATRALRAGVIPSGVFEPSGQQSATRLRWRTGDGQWHDGPDRRVRINHNGLSFARLSISSRDVREVSLAIPGRPALVRVDWIQATAFTGSAEPRVLRWDEPEHIAGLTLKECRWLGGNLLQFDTPHAAVWLSPAGVEGAPATSVEISVAFAMLPQSRAVPTPALPTPEPEPEPAPEPTLRDKARDVYRRKGLTGLVAQATRVAGRHLKRT